MSRVIIRLCNLGNRDLVLLNRIVKTSIELHYEDLRALRDRLDEVINITINYNEIISIKMPYKKITMLSRRGQATEGALTIFNPFSRCLNDHINNIDNDTFPDVIHILIIEEHTTCNKKFTYIFEDYDCNSREICELTLSEDCNKDHYTGINRYEVLEDIWRPSDIEPDEVDIFNVDGDIINLYHRGQGHCYITDGHHSSDYNRDILYQPEYYRPIQKSMIDIMKKMHPMMFSQKN